MINAVLRIAETGIEPLQTLLKPYGLHVQLVKQGEDIQGSFWGEEEAGLVANTLLVRADTPLHSALHEAGHYVCMDGQRRDNLHTNAGGDYDEENGVCYLQILWASQLPEMGITRMFKDMDSWGYSFRLGSARAWFEKDAEDAKAWLEHHTVIHHNQPTWKLRP